MAKQFEGEGKIKKERPDLLDIVKIDGRWAQVMGGGDTLRFLDDGSTREIDWNEYQLTQPFHSLAVETIEMAFGEMFTEKEIKNIHWGAEEEKTPALKKQVRVFGKFVKKDSKSTEKERQRE